MVRLFISRLETGSFVCLSLRFICSTICRFVQSACFFLRSSLVPRTCPIQSVKIRVTAKTFTIRANLFLQCFFLLRASVSSLVNEESMVRIRLKNNFEMFSISFSTKKKKWIYYYQTANTYNLRFIYRHKKKEKNRRRNRIHVVMLLSQKCRQSDSKGTVRSSSLKSYEVQLKVTYKG